VKTRYIKAIVFSSVNDIPKIEETVNSVINELTRQGNKIVSISSNVYGLSPMSLIYNIIYEGEVQGNFSN